MESISDFFSPEALRLLEGFEADCGTLFQPATPQAIQPGTLSPISVLNYSTLALGVPTKGKRKRAKFDTEARKKVANVRKTGACLRCRILKLPVGTLIFDS